MHDVVKIRVGDIYEAFRAMATVYSRSWQVQPLTIS
jgi:hypothetical protein